MMPRHYALELVNANVGRYWRLTNCCQHKTKIKSYFQRLTTNTSFLVYVRFVRFYQISLIRKQNILILIIHT